LWFRHKIRDNFLFWGEELEIHKWRRRGTTRERKAKAWKYGWKQSECKTRK
jgi:hypothetical protein